MKEKMSAERNIKQEFYHSKAWRYTRKLYEESVHGLCEICLKKGEYNKCDAVHHIIPLTQSNIRDPNISLNWDNLQAVCFRCHSELHKKNQRRYTVDSEGKVSAK